MQNTQSPSGHCAWLAGLVGGGRWTPLKRSHGESSRDRIKASPLHDDSFR